MRRAFGADLSTSGLADLVMFRLKNAIGRPIVARLVAGNVHMIRQKAFIVAAFSLTTACGVAFAQVTTPASPPSDNALASDQISTSQGIFFVPDLNNQASTSIATNSPNLLAGSFPNPPANTVVVGWTGLPKQTKWENWTLSCRNARLVVYADIQHKDTDLRQETFNLIGRCGEQAARKVGITVIMKDPRASFAAFAAAFGQCVASEGKKDLEAKGLRVDSEHDDWGKC